MRTAGEREDRERSVGRARDPYALVREESEMQNCIEEDGRAARIELNRRLERIRRDNANAPELLRYLACIHREPQLYFYNAAAARRLNWSAAKVADTKRNLKEVANRRWKSPFSNAFGASHKTASSRQ
jgi:hypothetical protein